MDHKYDEIWEEIKKIMAEKMTSVAINTWFGDCSMIDIADDHIVFLVPSAFKREVIQNRFCDILKDAVNQIFARGEDVLLLDEEAAKKYDRNQKDPATHFSEDDYTFENFVVGSSNKFAHAAAMAVATGEGSRGYNPLFIYGNSGLGKTHLLFAIRHEICKRHPEYNIVYVKGDDFTNDLVSAIQTGKNLEFRDKYRNADLFLMDDVQFIAGRESSQEEMFHTFNTLYQSGKQIVFTADRPPQEMLKLDDRLRTRFASGLPVDIQPPDYETRMAIIRNIAEQYNIPISDEVIEYVSEKNIMNVRQIEGILKQIKARHDIMRGTIDVEMAETAIRELYSSGTQNTITPDLIAETCANYFGFSTEEIKGQSRTKNLVLARQIAMFLMRRLTGLTQDEIGTYFGGKDHTTVISSLRKIENTIQTSPEFNHTIKDITANINSRL